MWAMLFNSLGENKLDRGVPDDAGCSTVFLIFINA